MDFEINQINLPYDKEDWVDADERIFDACFIILGQFVENELEKSNSKNGTYQGYNLHSTDSKDKTAIDLWLWYKDLDNLKEKVYESQKVSFKEYPYNYIEKLCDEKLQELMKIRTSLWT